MGQDEESADSLGTLTGYIDASFFSSNLETYKTRVKMHGYDKAAEKAWLDNYCLRRSFLSYELTMKIAAIKLFFF